MSTAGRMTLQRWQSLALLAAVGSVGLGFLASLDLRLVPVPPGWLLWLAHPSLAALGVAAGRAAVLRGRAVDEERWAVVDEPLATASEREYAHKEAERERRLAATTFLGVPVFLGYWWLYQFGAAGPGSWALPVTGLIGFITGFVALNRGAGPERRY